ncbi:COX15/CtaA family protein [uncultured Cohaesibacter sp.]|uniref:COX15/CtaA family protein n=1 Tax=uncultured Cohaesibacter sp. TaxID=1002546 RepID=UPI002AAAABD0|nr:COX15/CtaA family protein [uncultured Cohaesibacter sp.]
MVRNEAALESAIYYVDKEEDKASRSRHMVRFWLYCVAFLVFLMVVVGGITRLTDSGLSITEWKPIHGAIPPMSAEEWNEEFLKYQQIPEYERVNKGMTLDEFKNIFWWEWGHRQLGRFIGVAFFVPMLFFWISGRVTASLKPRLLVLLGLGGLQGFVGWWMVASGLVDRVDVSQYRLASHLILASIIFFALLWVARGYRTGQKMPECVSADRHVWLMGLLTICIMVQIFLGALVAGTHAGLIFNTWPLMDGRIIPEKIYDTGSVWHSIFEDHATIQFNHRMMAYLVAAICLLLWFRIRRDPFKGDIMMPVNILAGLLAFQVIIGITTLLFAVPFSLALLHQAGAMLVLGAATLVMRDLYDNARKY